MQRTYLNLFSSSFPSTAWDSWALSLFATALLLTVEARLRYRAFGSNTDRNGSNDDCDSRSSGMIKLDRHCSSVAMACGSTMVQAYRAPLALTVSIVGLAISAVRIVLAVIVCILSRVWQRKCGAKHDVQITANSNGPKEL
jgi:hypothetical protein